LFRELGTGRTALGVAAATGIFRNAELLIQAAASPLELDCDGRTPWQLALAGGSDLMAVWFEAMPVVYWAGHSQLRYRVAAGAVVLCCRWSRVRAPGAMHPDDWCIPRRDVYRILHFVGPELAGGVWPGSPRGWRGALPGRSARPVRRVPVRLAVEGGAAAPAAGAAAGTVAAYGLARRVYPYQLVDGLPGREPQLQEFRYWLEQNGNPTTFPKGLSEDGSWDNWEVW
jgi:hypothetical protein